MAHELSLRANGSAEMAFVGETPWHGLGQSVTKGASIGVWAKEAGMDWKAQEADVLFKVRGEVQTFPTSKVIYRSDTGAGLATVGSKYEIVQPLDMLEFFRDLTEGGGWHIHTAGVLRGGRKLWAMASNGESMDVRAKGANSKGAPDVIKQNLLLATSLDGSMKTTAALTAVRVVCANTLALALRNEKSAIEVSHRSVFDPQGIKRALGVARDSFDYFMQQAREMADTPVQLDEALDVLRQVFRTTVPVVKKVDTSWMGDLAQIEANAEAEDDVKESRVVSRVLELFAGAGMGADFKTAKGTRWGLFNAITQHVDHEMGRTQDTRLDSAWFGRGNSFKKEALELLAV